MTDCFTKEKRSDNMSKIRNKDTKIEILFRKALWRQGYRYLKNSTRYFGKPDLVLPKYKTVIFLDSCFWHGCKKHGNQPKSNQKYWINKLARNKKRDKQVNRFYKKEGWRVIRIWEHEVKHKEINNLNKYLTTLHEK